MQKAMSQVRAPLKIVPDGDVHVVMDYIEAYEADELMMISHNPFISNLLSVMADGTMEARRPLGTSTLVCVSMDIVAPSCGEILYTLEP